MNSDFIEKKNEGFGLAIYNLVIFYVVHQFYWCDCIILRYQIGTLPSPRILITRFYFVNILAIKRKRFRFLFLTETYGINVSKNSLHFETLTQTIYRKSWQKKATTQFFWTVNSGLLWIQICSSYISRLPTSSHHPSCLNNNFSIKSYSYYNGRLIRLNSSRCSQTFISFGLFSRTLQRIPLAQSLSTNSILPKQNFFYKIRATLMWNDVKRALANTPNRRFQALF